MQIVVLGVGYVGLVTASCLAEMGHTVACYDIDSEKLLRLRQGQISIFEPGLAEMIIQNQRAGRLRFTSDLTEAARACAVGFIAVGTPQIEATGAADISQVEASAQSLAQAWQNSLGPRMIVIKSTVPVGTCAAITSKLASAWPTQSQAPLRVAVNPEFLKEGMAVEDFMRPDRIVVGSDDPDDFPILRQVYAPFIRYGRPFLEMTSRSAEMTKYAANALLAARISLINELANLCEPLEADISDVHRGVGTDRRLGMNFLYAGIGYGGSCFPKDVRALAHMGDMARQPTPILHAVHRVNVAQRERLVSLLQTEVPELSGRTIALWGLAFKPRTDDVREAPAMAVLARLLALGARVRAFDPEAMPKAQAHFAPSTQLTYTQSPLEACQGACALLICTEWGVFRNPDFAEVRGALTQPLIVDGRNLFDPQMVADAGLTYLSIGRARRSPSAP